jgi:co-chaperonin GroES (HSP10)
MSTGLAYDTTAPTDKERKNLASQLPTPVGYSMLIMLPKVKDRTESGVVIPDERRNAETVASIVGFVMKQGPDCYTDKTRFPSGRWCKEGDWILMRSYAGTRFTIRGEEFRLINDDSIEAVVEDPRGIARV